MTNQYFSLYVVGYIKCINISHESFKVICNISYSYPHCNVTKMKKLCALLLDPEDPEYIRQMRRPAEVKEDVRQMVTRQRVSSTLNAQMFRDELEEIVKETLSQHPTPANMLALQQITEMLVPQSRFNQSTMRCRFHC